jgi:hypothetical protein
VGQVADLEPRFAAGAETTAETSPTFNDNTPPPTPANPDDPWNTTSGHDTATDLPSPSADSQSAERPEALFLDSLESFFANKTGSFETAFPLAGDFGAESFGSGDFSAMGAEDTSAVAQQAPVYAAPVGQLSIAPPSNNGGPNVLFRGGLDNGRDTDALTFPPLLQPLATGSPLRHAAASSVMQPIQTSSVAFAAATLSPVGAAANLDATPTRFLAQGPWFNAAVDATGFRFTPANGSGSVAVQLVGSDPSASASTTAALPGTSGFLASAPAGAEAAGNATFAAADYHNVYPGIDLHYNPTTNQNLEYSFMVHPGTDPSTIRLTVPGANGLNLDAQGNLVLHTPAGDFVSTAPVLFQEVNSSRVPVQGGYARLADGEIGFRVGRYDRTQLLTIDPELNDPPVVVAGGNATGVVGQPVYIESIFSDDDGTGPYTVTVAWGDSNTDQQSFTEPPLDFFTSTHTYNLAGQYTVTVTALDTAVGNSGSDTLTVTVNPPGPPITTTTAVPDDCTTDENVAADIPVLANDIAAPDTTLTVTGLTQPTHGSVSLNGNGIVHYVPENNWFGADSFTYTISDGDGGTSTATVTTTVTWVDLAPTPGDDTVTTSENTPVTINVVANDTAPNPDTFANGSLWVSGITQPQNGTAAYNGDGTITYIPNGQFNSLDADGNLTNVDAFSYTLSTWAGASATATVHVTVTPVYDPPIAYSDFYALPPNVESNAGPVLINDFDPDWRDANYNPGNMTVFAVDTQGTQGTVTMHADGTFKYEPPLDFAGWTTFRYTITDGTFVSPPATVFLYVQPVQQPDPTPGTDDGPPPPPPPSTFGAQNDYYLTNDNGVGGNVLANDTNATRAILLSRPTQGIFLTFSSGGSFLYMPEVNVTQVEMVSYEAVDNLGHIALANVEIDRPRPWFMSMTHNFNAPLPYPGNKTLEIGDKLKSGGYVHYNEDDDDRATSAFWGTPIPDKDKTGPVANEKDLIPFQVWVRNAPNKGTVTLTRSNTNIRVWRTSNKGAGNQVLVSNDSKTWDLANDTERADFQSLGEGNLNQAKMWVEGYAIGTSTLTLTYKDEAGADIASDTLNWTVFGATAGRQPTPEEHDQFVAAWPKLVDCEWSITAEPTPRPNTPGYNAANFYNCFAWSVGETNTWYNDIRPNPNWPTSVGIDQFFGNNNGVFELVEDLDKFYAAKGYQLMAKVGQDDRPDIMYYDGKHAAAKKNALLAPGIPLSQLYESKLGWVHRIEHVWNQLDGSTNPLPGYGNRVRYYKKA